jgi:nucleotide-binding universal stress UspA family protein
VTAHQLPPATDPRIELVLEDSRHEAAQQALSDGVALAHEIDPSIPVQTLSKIGSIVAPLIDSSPDVAAVVLGRRRHPSARSWVGASTILPVVAKAACPVFVVNPEWSGDEEGTVMAYFDGTPASCSAVEYALAHAAAHQLGATILQRVPMPHPADGGDRDRAGLDQAFATAQTELVAYVAGWRQRFPDVHIEYRIESAWNMADFVLRQSRGAGLLVLSHPNSGGHRQLEHAIHTVLRHAVCPVVLVRPDPADHDAIEQDAGSATAVR